jgi:hypothetical protein
LLQTHPGAQAVKLGPRLVGSSGRRRTNRSGSRGPRRSFALGPSTECVSSSRCQIAKGPDFMDHRPRAGGALPQTRRSQPSITESAARAAPN